MKKKLFLFGTPEIAVPSFEVIAKLEEYEIVGVGVPPDKPIGRKQIMTACPVKNFAKKFSLPIYEISDKKNLARILKTVDFDLGIVIAFGVIFPAEVLENNKFINVHFSLLPKYRGASPVQSAILNGEKFSGITWQFLAKKLDTGDILFTQKENISDKNTIEIWENFAQKTAEIFPQFLHNFFTQKLSPKSQDDNLATYCSKFARADGLINYREETVENISRKFRAFVPFPQIFINTKYGQLKLLEISKTEKRDEKNLVLFCADGEIFIQKAQLAGKKIMSAQEILNGWKDILE